MTSLILQQLTRIKTNVDRQVNYVSDMVCYDLPERWHSFYPELTKNPKAKFSGDCEDIAYTYAEFCVKELLFDPAKVKIVFCLVNKTGYHMACAVEVDNTTYILCSNLPTIVEMNSLTTESSTELHYKYIKYMCMDHIGSWVEY